jgi:5-methylcytosine-specific restriction endonuclease McrA
METNARINVLAQPVLKLNRLWQALDETNVETAFLDLCRGAIMAIDTTDMRWDEWIKLPIRESDQSIGTIRGQVRVPRVVLCVQYAGLSKKCPRLDSQGIKQRDKGICQVTGELAPDGNVDHLVPISRGGAKKSWKNMVWMRRDLNGKKGNHTLKEMGWKLIRPPQEPREAPACVYIKPRFPEWAHFLQK